MGSWKFGEMSSWLTVEFSVSYGVAVWLGVLLRRIGVWKGVLLRRIGVWKGVLLKKVVVWKGILLEAENLLPLVRDFFPHKLIVCFVLGVLVL